MSDLQPLNTPDGSALLRKLGYVSEAAAFNGEKMYPHSRAYVASQEPGYVVLAVKRSGVPYLVWRDGALELYAAQGHNWAIAVIGDYVLASNARVHVPSRTCSLSLVTARRVAPALLDVLFQPQDVKRLLAKYDAKRKARRGA